MDFLNKFKELDIPIYGVRLPRFELDESYKKQFDITGKISNYDFLRKLCLLGFKKLNLEKGSDEHEKYVKRIKHELETIKELGFVDYILMVWDVINFCKVNDIPTGRGRGSAVGSIILYLLNVTKINPIKYGLYFERFISKVRAKQKIIDGISYVDGKLAPDIDNDICYYQRDKVIQYLENKYKNRVCKILTLNTLSGKLLVKECGKIVGGYSDDYMTDVTELIPKIHGVVADLEEAYEDVPEFKKWCDENLLIYQTCLKLRNLNKNKGVHPSAVSISYDLIDNLAPTEFDSNKERISSYEMNQIGLFNIKLDILGLRCVSVIDDVCKSLNIKEEEIDVEDPIIYQHLQDFKHPHGIFQIEAESNFRVARKVKPKNLKQLSDVVALVRPGASQFIEKYAKYVNNNEYESIHPFFDEILKDTAGSCLFQEQAMRMACKIGFSLEESESIRYCIGKKLVDEIPQWKLRIEEKVKENHLDPEVGKIFWKIVEDSSGYQFNASHATSYGSLAATCIYLKFKYPLQFFLSLLKMTRFEPDPISEISKIHKEMQDFGIKLLRPHITKSQLNFSIEGNDIRFGLLSIKGIADKSIEKLSKFKNEYSTKFEVFEGANAAELHNNILCSLIQAGCFEGFKQSRCKVVYEAQLWNLLTDKEKKLALSLEKDFDYDLVKIVTELSQRKNEKGKSLIKESRIATIRKHAEPYKQIFNLNSKSENYANWAYEKKLLGYTHGMTLRDIFIERNPNLTTIKEIKKLPENSEVFFVAEVEANSQSRTSKNDNKYISFDCADEGSSINVKVFEKNIESILLINDGKTPKKGQVVIVKGVKKEGNCVFGSEYGIQDNKIVTKFADIKEEK